MPAPASEPVVGPRGARSDRARVARANLLVVARWLLPALAISACAMPDDVEVRHLASTKAAEAGGVWHLFLFEPEEPRPLDTRIRLARSEISRDPACGWVAADRDAIAAETRRQGPAFADRVLAAPLLCRG